MISSDGAGRRALTRAMKISHDLKEEVVSVNMSGKTDPQIVVEILVSQGHSPEQAKESVDKVLELYLSFLDEEIERSKYYIIHPGVREVLDQLEGSTASLALLTGNVEPGARKKLARFSLNHYFPFGAYGCDSANRLDLPAFAVKRARETLGVEFAPDELVVIGDSINDVACAHGYGARAIAVNTGRTSWQELEEQKPAYLLKDLSNTQAVLSAIFSD